MDEFSCLAEELEAYRANKLACLVDEFRDIYLMTLRSAACSPPVMNFLFSRSMYRGIFLWVIRFLD